MRMRLWPAHLRPKPPQPSSSSDSDDEEEAADGTFTNKEDAASDDSSSKRDFDAALALIELSGGDITKRKKKRVSDMEKNNEECSVRDVSTNVPAVEAFEGISGFQFVDPAAMKMMKIKENGRYRPMAMWNIWEKEHSKWVDYYLSKKPNLDQKNSMMCEIHKEPSELLTRLLRFQKEWLSWALKMEESIVRGGILADEMGMGKTVQTIALVLAKREIRQAKASNGVGHSLPVSSSSSVLPELNCTLVICPLSALHQWQREIARFTGEETTKVLCYQGSKRVKDPLQLCGYDFVITTYDTVEVDYRSFLPKQKCQWCGKQLYERMMVYHLKHSCGRRAHKTVEQAKQDRKGKKSLSKVSLNSVLHSVKWERIVLDEAHRIKGRQSNIAWAIFALESSHKWALTGTPILNRIGELHSLICFLQIPPYSYYFCKDCDCRVLDYSSTVECKKCNHKSSRHFCWWIKNVAKPIERYGNRGDGHRAMILLKHKILANVLLRRTKSERASELGLPRRIISERRDTFDVVEDDFYQALVQQSQAKFKGYLAKGTLMAHYAEVIGSLTCLRKAADHPYLVGYSRANSARNESIDEIDNDEQACAICHNPVEDLAVSSCEHPFCKECLDFSSTLDEALCPICSKPLIADVTSKSGTGSQRNESKVNGFRSSSILNRIKLDDFQTSTKIEALREEIRFMIERDGSAKGIVFSQFTAFLDLIMYSLQKSGISCALLDGSMTITARDNSIKRFREDPGCRIFLMGLKSGGVALNLTVASHVFMMDPWWNTATEGQAIDRIHRIGQCKPIRIVRFAIEGTIEEKIWKLQEKKDVFFEGTVKESSDALDKLTQKDLINLFGLS